MDTSITVFLFVYEETEAQRETRVLKFHSSQVTE